MGEGEREGLGVPEPLMVGLREPEAQPEGVGHWVGEGVVEAQGEAEREPEGEPEPVTLPVALLDREAHCVPVVEREGERVGVKDTVVEEERVSEVVAVCDREAMLAVWEGLTVRLGDRDCVGDQDREPEGQGEAERERVREVVTEADMDWVRLSVPLAQALLLRVTLAVALVLAVRHTLAVRHSVEEALPE